jgi:hypothetical protein
MRRIPREWKCQEEMVLHGSVRLPEQPESRLPDEEEERQGIVWLVKPWTVRKF